MGCLEHVNADTEARGEAWPLCRVARPVASFAGGRKSHPEEDVQVGHCVDGVRDNNGVMQGFDSQAV